MIVKFNKNDMLSAYSGYDFGKNQVAVNVKDGDGIEVSDSFGKYLLKTFPGNFSKGSKEDLPENRIKAEAEAKAKAEAEANKKAEDEAKK